jgi:hypothetical protein
MRRSVIAGLLCLLAALPASTVSAQGGGPASCSEPAGTASSRPRLQSLHPLRSTWPTGGDRLRRGGDGDVHCLRDDRSRGDYAPLLGTERLIRADLFHGQPCPTDPPTFEWSWLFPRFGWDYYICHTFDSPW